MEGNRDDARLLRRPNTLYLNENSCARIALRLASSCQDFTFLCLFFPAFFFPSSPGCEKFKLKMVLGIVCKSPLSGLNCGTGRT